ncbi:alpha/beta fold hydrolase [Aquimarina sp. ERC-38]|uniref:alpha/beta fold hydrolase n=1 Tax=Aquimarina sp. ERC-38 TaxID=2949996 RepID=UPI0022454D57|nr:alpha/beta fold hydrolase [Aquimarina sp. ERC-38]UZO81176.1 alpha/beta fold hydrolase [Aquimarina sp. ERC-38]
MKLYSNIFGEGHPFIILHGFLGMGDNWKTVGKKLTEKGFEVHLVDQRNHGRSPHSDQFSYDLMVQDLHQYFTDHTIQKSILLGHSMGGKTAMQFACENSNLVDQLIIADISPKYYPLHHQDILDGLQALDFNTITSRNEADQALAPFVPDAGVRMFLLKNLVRIDQKTFGLRMALDSLVTNVSEIGKKLPDYLSFKGKTLFLKGAKSSYIRKEDETLIKHHFPQADLEVISNAGHWLHAENQPEFLEKLVELVE